MTARNLSSAKLSFSLFTVSIYKENNSHVNWMPRLRFNLINNKFTLIIHKNKRSVYWYPHEVTQDVFNFVDNNKRNARRKRPFSKAIVLGHIRVLTGSDSGMYIAPSNFSAIAFAIFSAPLPGAPAQSDNKLFFTFV